VGRLIVRRLISVPPVLLVVSFAVFLLLELVPGDPAVTLAGGASATPAQIARVRRQLHLNDPVLVQYWHWLWGVLHLNFGNSLATGLPVSTQLASRFPVTLSLRPHGVIDGGARVISSVGVAMPNFWLAVILVSAFAVQVRLFPSSGFTQPTSSLGQWARDIVLPASALGIAVAAALARQLRGAIVDVMDAAYVRTAWAKGITRSGVMCGHVLKNAAMPAITVLGLQIGYLLGGAVIIEQIFSIPGLGTYMLQGITDHDLPVVQGVALLFVLFQMGMSLLVDISYGYLNPKVRVA
jgi:peptide/nickel transport system permease protein